MLFLIEIFLAKKKRLVGGDGPQSMSPRKKVYAGRVEPRAGHQELQRTKKETKHASRAREVFLRGINHNLNSAQSTASEIKACSWSRHGHPLHLCRPDSVTVISSALCRGRQPGCFFEFQPDPRPCSRRSTRVCLNSDVGCRTGHRIGTGNL